MEKIQCIKEADKALETLQQVAVLTKGASMRPLFREHKDVAIIEKLTREPRKNDVLLYRKAGYSGLVLHRLVRIKRDGTLVFRGDNNTFTEYDIKREDIVGILTEYYRGGKKRYICRNFLGYKLYSFYILHSYPIRFAVREGITIPFRKLYRKINGIK